MGKVNASRSAVQSSNGDDRMNDFRSIKYTVIQWKAVCIHSTFVTLYTPAGQTDAIRLLWSVTGAAPVRPYSERSPSVAVPNTGIGSG